MKDLEKKSISELFEMLEKAEKEERDDDWSNIFEEIMDRVPFSTLDENVGEQEKRINEIENEIDKLRSLLKQHKHLENKVLIEVE